MSGRPSKSPERQALDQLCLISLVGFVLLVAFSVMQHSHNGSTPPPTEIAATASRL